MPRTGGESMSKFKHPRSSRRDCRGAAAVQWLRRGRGASQSPLVVATCGTGGCSRLPGVAERLLTQLAASPPNIAGSD